MAIDKLTLDYFNNDFPGWDYSKPVEIAENPYWTEVPVVELDLDLDVEYLRHLAKGFDPKDYGTQTREHGSYQKEKRIVGWECNKILWNHGNRPTYAHDIRNYKLADKLEIIKPDVQEKALEDYLISKGLNFKVLLHMQLIPNSYLRPHRDFSDNWPLLYAWIPVNYPEGSELRFYPLGTVPITEGKVYLFNQYHFVHAIRNTNPELIRDCIIGHLDENIQDTPEWRQRVIDAINEQYNS